jgi:hypothetical protein
MHRKTLGLVTVICLLLCLFADFKTCFSAWMVALGTISLNAALTTGNRRLFIVWAPGGNTGLILDDERLAEDIATGEIFADAPLGVRPRYDAGVGMSFRHQAVAGLVETARLTGPDEDWKEALKTTQLKMQEISTEVLP